MSAPAPGIVLGDVEIIRVIEWSGPVRTARFILPDSDEETWRRNEDWLAPDFWTPADNAYRCHVQTFVLRSEGRTILVEPINSRDMPGHFLNDFNHAAEIVETLNHPHVKLQFDIYHRQIIHGDVLTALETMMPIIGHIQTASVPKRNEPGTGELDDFRIFRALDELGYAGWVGCEYRPKGATLDGLGWLEKARAGEARGADIAAHNLGAIF